MTALLIANLVVSSLILLLLFPLGVGAASRCRSRPRWVSPAWTIHVDGVDDVTADTRGEAITALTEQVLAVLPGSGYSTLVPQGLAGLP